MGLFEKKQSLEIVYRDRRYAEMEEGREKFAVKGGVTRTALLVEHISGHPLLFRCIEHLFTCAGQVLFSSTVRPLLCFSNTPS